jgi:Lon protease-like protein
MLSSATWPEAFDGVVKLFPLPNLVLFPSIAQPLHIFEPRYCAMLTDALASDGLIAMATLEPDWEGQYDQKPPMAGTVCIGKVVAHSDCERGTHNILLIGMKRARIVRELDSGKPYRTAEVELLEDQYPTEDAGHRPGMIRRLQELFLQFIQDSASTREGFQRLIAKQIPLGRLTDTIAYSMDLPMAIKFQLLSENNVDIRCRILTRCLEQKIKMESESNSDLATDKSFVDKFPPPFSEN